MSINLHDGVYTHMYTIYVPYVCFARTIERITLMIFKFYRLVVFQSHFKHKCRSPPWPCRPSGTFGTGRTDSDFADVCPPGKPSQPSTRTWSPSARSSWRSPCSPRRCARHNAGRPRCRRTRRKAGSGSEARVRRFRAMANWRWNSWCHRCRAASGIPCSHYC